MIRITCPYCGPRDHAEFTYIGDATKTRPQDPANASAEDWHDYVYLRDNPRGPHLEFWQHSQGCRAIVKVRRDVLTHEVIDTGTPSAKLRTVSRRTSSPQTSPSETTSGGDRG